MTTRHTEHTPEEYRSSLLDMLGLSSPYERAVTQVRTDIAIERATPGVDLESPFPRIAELPRTVRDDPMTDGLVQRLWQASEADEQDLVADEWSPEAPADRVVGRYRWAWWPVLIGALTIGSILVVMSFRAIPAGQADELRQEWAASALVLESAVPGARDATAIVTNPSAGTTELAEARNEMISFDSSAVTLEQLISRPFPTPPPLASGEAFDPLKPIQAELLAGTALAAGVEDQLADAITYRNLLEQSFLLPALPIAADDVTRTDLSLQLATAIAASRERVRQLPLGASFEAHRASALALVTRLESWQATYLDALRLSDIDAATDLKIEIEDRTSALRGSLDEPLTLVAEAVNADLDELDVILETSLSELTTVE